MHMPFSLFQTPSYITCSCSIQLSKKIQLLLKGKMVKNQKKTALKFLDIVFILVINVKMQKMPSIVGILTFMSMMSFILSRVEHEKVL